MILKPVEGGYKYCPRCKKVYPLLTYFSKDRSRKDGFNVYCKLCVSKLKRKYYHKNRNEKRNNVTE